MGGVSCSKSICLRECHGLRLLAQKTFRAGSAISTIVYQALASVSQPSDPHGTSGIGPLYDFHTVLPPPCSCMPRTNASACAALTQLSHPWGIPDGRKSQRRIRGSSRTFSDAPINEATSQPNRGLPKTAALHDPWAALEAETGAPRPVSIGILEIAHGVHINSDDSVCAHELRVCWQIGGALTGVDSLSESGMYQLRFGFGDRRN